MERTYNPFVDNGLFIVGYYLNKKIEDITVQDIKDNIGMLSSVVAEYVNHPAFNALAWGAFSNSSYTQNCTNNETREHKIQDQLSNKFMKNIGTEYCSVCGKNTANHDVFVTRSYMPSISSDTFYNYANNLKGINICPICVTLCMMSILNMRQCEQLIIYNSDNDEYMYQFTKLRQEENKLKLEIPAEEYKKVKVPNSRKFLQEEIKYYFQSTKSYKGYLQPILFKNFGQDQAYREYILQQRYMEILLKLYNENLLDEFFELQLLDQMLNNNFENGYIYKIIDFRNLELKCSYDLYEVITGEVNKLMDENTLNLIVEVCNKLSKISQEDEIKDLKTISNIRNFEKLLLQWQENYKKQTGEDIFTMEQFNELTNRYRFLTIRNRFISQFIVLYNSQNEREGIKDEAK